MKGNSGVVMPLDLGVNLNPPAGFVESIYCNGESKVLCNYFHRMTAELTSRGTSVVCRPLNCGRPV